LANNIYSICFTLQSTGKLSISFESYTSSTHLWIDATPRYIVEAKTTFEAVDIMTLIGAMDISWGANGLKRGKWPEWEMLKDSKYGMYMYAL
jgi:hypothetical protein